MYVTYKPEDGEPREWQFDPKRVRASKAEMIEKRFGQSWDQWRAAIQAGSMKARRVLLWHLLSVEHPTLRFEDAPDFLDEEVQVQYELHELREIRDRVEKANMSEDEREQLFAALDVEISEAIAREEAQGVEPEGKATSNSDVNATPSPSPSSSTSGPGSSESS